VGIAVDSKEVPGRKDLDKRQHNNNNKDVFETHFPKT
jgi:hypothetical protein